MEKKLLLWIVLSIAATFTGWAQDKKPTLAVMEFDIAAGNYSRHQLGAGLSDMLTNALVETGKYRVVERKRLEEILREQNLGLDGTLSPTTSASIGRMVGAGYLVMGTVTEFKEKESGGGVSAFLLGGANVGVDVYQSHIGFTIRIVSSSSGVILISESIDKKVKKVGFAGRGLLGVPAGAVGYKSQAMQDAMEQAIKAAVVIIGEEIANLPNTDVTQTINSIEIVASNVDFGKLMSMSEYLKSLDGVSDLKKSMSQSVGHLYFQYTKSIDEIAGQLLAADNFKVNITGFSDNKIELKVQ